MLWDRWPLCLSVTLVHCDQTVEQIEMKLGMRVGLVKRIISVGHTDTKCYYQCVKSSTICLFQYSLTKDLAPFLCIPHKKPSFKPTNNQFIVADIC